MTTRSLIPFVAAAALSLAACGDSNDDTTAPKTTTAAAKPAAETRPWPAGPDTPLSAGKTYATKVFQPALTLSIPDGTTAKTLDEEAEKVVSVAALVPEPIEQNTLALHRIDRVLPVVGARAISDAVEAPEDILAWLAEHPHLEATAPTPVEINGVTGMQMDVTVTSAPKRIPDECVDVNRDCVPLFIDYVDGAEEILVYPVGTKTRFFSLDVGDAPVIAEIFADPAEEFEKVNALLEPILRSVTFSEAG